MTPVYQVRIWLPWRNGGILLRRKREVKKAFRVVGITSEEGVSQ